jgi:uncharacterized protein (DUF2141 family)
VTKLLLAVLIPLVLVSLFGCGGASTPDSVMSRPDTTGPISVSISPTTASLQINGSQPFAAAVANDPKNSGVTWSLDVVRIPAMGSLTCNNGIDCGQISPPSTASGVSALYTGPSAVFDSQTLQVLVTATSVADNTKSATVTVSIIPPPISVDINPGSALIPPTGTMQFSAGVTNDSNNAGVTWSISGCAGDATVCGILTDINNAGPYTADYVAPATVPPGGKVSVTATSVTDNTQSATATITINPINFRSVNYPAGNSPDGVAIADFNNDGELDIAVADYGNPSTGDNGGVSILLGNGDGTFQPAISANAGKNPIWIAAGDFNNDGKKDLVIADFGDRQTGGSGTVQILLGNGDGTFQSPSSLSVGNEPFSLSVGDFNGDGKLDFAVSDFSAGLYVFLGKGDGSFKAPSLINAGTNPVAVVVADLNGDGKLDVAVADLNDPSNVDNGGVSVLLGNGDGTFQTPAFYAVSIFPTSIAIGDINADGKPDLAISSFVSSFGLEGSALNVLLGNGDGTFGGNLVTRTGRTLSGSVFPLSVAIAKFNSTGKQDIAEVIGPYISVLPGNGDGTLQAGLSFSADQGPFQLSVGDFNRDGKPDIVVANRDSNDITILLNATVP